MYGPILRAPTSSLNCVLLNFFFIKQNYFGVRSKPLRKTAAALSPCVEHPPSKANGGTVSVDSVPSDQPQCAVQGNWPRVHVMVARGVLWFPLQNSHHGDLNSSLRVESPPCTQAYLAISPWAS